jgi:hypothetical protein
MHHPAVMGQGNYPRRLEHSFHVLTGDFLLRIGNRNHTPVIDRSDRDAGDAYVSPINFPSAHLFSLLNRLFDRADRVLDINDAATADSRRGNRTKPDDLQLAVGPNASYYDCDFSTTYV